MADLKITYLPIDALDPRSTNPRTHTPKQIEQLAASIKRFGFTNPVLVDAKNGLIAGHGRLAAAKLLSMVKIPTVCLAGMSNAEIRAYVIADNKLAENAGWDPELLGLELAYLSDIETDFDVTLTGFTIPEVDVLIQGLTTISDDAPNPADEVVAVASGPAITQPGDTWQICRHRLICGDSTKIETYEHLLKGEKAQMVFTDPPYNVPISSHVCGLGKTKHREFAMASGEMSPAEFTMFLSTVFEHLARSSVDGSIHFQCMDWRHMPEMLKAGDAAYSELKNLCVWAKTNGGMGSLYRSQHELVFVYKSGTAAHINNVELGKNGRNRTNVWSYAGVNSFGLNRDDLTLHPTVKPTALVADAILDCSCRDAIVLDAFAGSGTTLVAAHQTGRRGYGIEIDPLYCDVIVRRMQKLFKLEARLQGTKASFADVEAQRSTETLSVSLLEALPSHPDGGLAHE